MKKLGAWADHLQLPQLPKRGGAHPGRHGAARSPSRPEEAAHPVPEVNEGSWE